MTKSQKAEQAESIERLRDMLPPGSTVRCVLRSVSRSGMSRQIDFYHVNADGGLDYLTGYIGQACDYRRAPSGALKVSGCGMDMGFSVVYDLSRALFGDGFECPGNGNGEYHRGCPSNDHSNGDRDYTPHHHKDGGYALRCEWI